MSAPAPTDPGAHALRGACIRCRAESPLFTPGDRCRRDGALIVDAAAIEAGDGDPLLGADLAGFALFGRLGEGEGSAVYEGVRDGVFAAVKVVRAVPEYGGFEGPAARSLAREGDLLRRADPAAGVPRWVAAGRAERLLFLAMERVRGARLDRLGTISLRSAAALAAALANLHRHGIAHGDLKPSHALLVSEAVVRLVDFGSGVQGPAATPPESDAFTPAFAAPERGRLGPTPASDVFALGRIFRRLWPAGSSVGEAMEAPDPRARPTAAEVVAALGRIAPDM